MLRATAMQTQLASGGILRHGLRVRADELKESPIFATTCWSLVLAAGDVATPHGREALEQLCRAYWYPLYAYLRRRGNNSTAAQDLTQGFFARLLDRNDLAGLTREGGRFRSFLLTSMNRFLASEHERASAQKRGGGRVIVSLDDTDAEDRYLREPSHSESPDRLFERQWALALMETAMERLAAEKDADGKAGVFAALRPFLSRDPGPGEYADAAHRLGITAGALAVQVCRLRERYRELVRAAVADTVNSPLEIEDEMRHLLIAVAGS